MSSSPHANRPPPPPPPPRNHPDKPSSFARTTVAARDRSHPLHVRAPSHTHPPPRSAALPITPAPLHHQIRQLEDSDLRRCLDDARTLPDLHRAASTPPQQLHCRRPVSRRTGARIRRIERPPRRRSNSTAVGPFLVAPELEFDESSGVAGRAHLAKTREPRHARLSTAAASGPAPARVQAAGCASRPRRRHSNRPQQDAAPKSLLCAANHPPRHPAAPPPGAPPWFCDVRRPDTKPMGLSSHEISLRVLPLHSTGNL